MGGWGSKRYDPDLHQRDAAQGLGAGQAKGTEAQLMQSWEGSRAFLGLAEDE